MDEDLDTLEEALGYLIHAFKRPHYWERVQQAAGMNIDRPGAYLLSTLYECNSSCRLQDLAAKVGVEAPSVTRIVQRLEQEQLIQRSVDPTDRRAIHVRPTPRGLRTVKSLRQAKRALLRDLLQEWEPDERKQLVQLLHRLAEEASNQNSTNIIQHTNVKERP